MKLARLPVILLLLLLAAPTGAAAFQSHCRQHFAGGQAPDLTVSKLAANSKEVCFRGYAALHSGTTRTPVWSAEHLTGMSALAARSTERNDDFHPESRLPPDQRAELADYRGSGLDRGHMVPNSDLADQDEEEETFSLANVVPQDPASNRGLWAEIERAVRHLAERDGDLFVVTGPINGGGEARWLRGRVRVPDHLFKAVYDPAAGAAGAYVAVNGPGREWRAVSIAELERETGIDVFPSLAASVKAAEPRLPEPEGRRGR